MKNILLACILCCGTLVHAEKIMVKEFKIAGPFKIQQPVLVDNTDVKGKKFEYKDLLQNHLSPLTALESDHIVSASTDGLHLLASTKSDTHQLGIVGFYLNSDRFTTGKLEVNGPTCYEIFIDGKKLNGNGSFDLSLEPRRYDVAIKYLYVEGEAAQPLKVQYEPTGDAIVTASANAEKRYTMKEAMDGRRLQMVHLSPNGHFLLKSYQITLPGGSSQHYQQVIDVTSEKILIDNDQRGLSWMPKSNKLYFVQKSLIGQELRTIDPVTLQETSIAQNIPNGHFTFSPTEDFLIYTLMEEGPKEDTDMQQILVPDDRQPGWRNRFSLHKYDLSTGVMQRLTYGFHSTYLNDISRDGKFILFTCSEEQLTERPFSITSLYKMDLDNGTSELLLKDKFLGNALFSDINPDLLVINASGEAFNGIGLNIREGQISNMADGQLFVYQQNKSNSILPCTKDFNPAVKDFEIVNGIVYFLAEDKDFVRLYSFDPANIEKGIKKYSLSEQIITGFSVSKTQSNIIYYGESDSNAQRLHAYVSKGKKGNSTCMEDLSADLLKDVLLGDVVDWNFKAAAGDTIYGRFYLPPHFDATKKYPLIVNYYGGTSPTERSMENRYASHVYAAQGYVVYIIQPSGATGFGQEFSARHVNAWGKRTADEIIEGTQLFCKEHSFIDKEKIGCIGASYGGFMTQLLQTKTDIFTAAISHAGISDITSYWGEGYWGYSYGALASANQYPWNAPQMYTQQSPLFNADKINTPLLFLHGTVDTNVPIGESIQMFTALKLLGKETAFIQVTDQNHHIMDYDKRLKWNKTIFAWFAKWLKGQPEWWNSLYPQKNL